MGVALGWIAFALSGVAAAPHPGRQTEQITYTVRYVEAEGLGWREAVFTRLKPVSRQGAATIWTIPASATTRLVAHASKTPTASVVQAPKVTAFSGAPASVHSRSNRKLVTQVAWNGDDRASGAAAEDVRVGWHTTVIGRKLDQGILVQIVLEDTQIRAVHHLNLTAGPHTLHQPKTLSAGSTPNAPSAPSSGLHVDKNGFLHDTYEFPWNTKKAETKEEACTDLQACCESPTDTGNDQEVRQVSIDVPEIGSQEVAGEWLIPNGENLLVSFGAYSVADKDGKAIVKERLAIIGAEEALVANRLPGANPMASPSALNVPNLATPMPAPALPVPPIAKMPASAPTLPPVANVPLPVPAIPSRSFPQGYHADGKPADLPELPDDDADDSSSSESSEPMPSPQTKKPAQAKPKPPATDTGTTKAEYVPSKFPSFSLSNFLPTSTTGLQFLVPIKPFTLKLPFNQRLQIEILGKVVADTETR